MTALAWYTVTLLGSLPAVVVSLLVAQLRYGITLTVSPAVVAAVLLTAFTGTMLGYALGHALPNPMTIQLAEGVLRFVVFGLSPILFPAEQLPGWLAAISWWLPFGHMAVIVRDALAPEMVADAPISYVVVAVWGVGCAAIAAWALGWRRLTPQRPFRRRRRPGNSRAPSAPGPPTGCAASTGCSGSTSAGPASGRP